MCVFIIYIYINCKGYLCYFFSLSRKDKTNSIHSFTLMCLVFPLNLLNQVLVFTLN